MGLLAKRELKCTFCGSLQGDTRGWLINGLCPNCSPSSRNEAHAFEPHAEGWCLRCGYEKESLRHNVPAAPPEKKHTVVVEETAFHHARVRCTCGLHCNYDGPNAVSDALTFKKNHLEHHARTTPAGSPKMLSTDNLLHRLWTKAVGTPDYDKEEWKTLERAFALRPQDRDARPEYVQDAANKRRYWPVTREAIQERRDAARLEWESKQTPTRPATPEPPYPDATDLLCEDEEP